MTHDEMIALIEAHRDGKTIQYRLTPKAEWRDRTLLGADFNFADICYRIKPESLTLKECWSRAWQSSLVMEHVLVEFIKLAKENGRA